VQTNLGLKDGCCLVYAVCLMFWRLKEEDGNVMFELPRKESEDGARWDGRWWFRGWVM
jgi:hypothetical protein